MEKCIWRWQGQGSYVPKGSDARHSMHDRAFPLRKAYLLRVKPNPILAFLHFPSEPCPVIKIRRWALWRPWNILLLLFQIPHLFRVVQLLGLVLQDRRRVRKGPRAEGEARRAQGPPVGQGTGAGRQIRLKRFLWFLTYKISLYVCELLKWVRVSYAGCACIW